MNCTDTNICIDPCYLTKPLQRNMLKTIFGNAKIDNQGYYKISSKKEGNHMKKLHRLIVEHFYQINLPKDWVVHHINQNRVDNRITNLQILPKQKHDKLHGISNETALKLSESQNTTGFFRVKKHKDNSCKQGFTYRYCYYENNTRKTIERVDLNKLKEAVIEKGLIWRRIK